jgi:broad specificity phosphatase PhoE
MNFKTLLIFRHGEKPGDPSVDASSDGVNLSTKGYERAGALAPYVPATFGVPDFLFATKASDHSNRPVETITPLAAQTHLEIHSEFNDNDYAQLAAKLTSDDKYAGKRVLVCWHHGTIPALVSALGYTPPVDRWPSDSFDRVWVVENASGPAAAAEVQNLPQRLLFGDDSD